MKYLSFVLLIAAGAGLVMSCSESDPSATSSISLKMAATTATGKTSFSGRIQTSVSLTEVKVNIREIEFEFDHEDEHFKSDSCFREGFEDHQSGGHHMGMSGGAHDNEANLKGPFILDLMNAGEFVDQVITTVDVPNANYEKIKFKLSPGQEAGDMLGKSILINGETGGKPFVFWHDGRAKFGAKFNDSTMVASGAEATIAIQLQLDKVMSALNGGVDLSKATDGNNDGTITIDPLDTDGNKELADDILMLIGRQMFCKHEKK